MTISQRVESILGHSRAARNSDLELWLIYAQKAGLGLTEAQITTLSKLPAFETIRRTRQKLQEQGKYPADESVDKSRYAKFKEVRQYITYKSPEELLESRGYKILPFGE